nr:MAG TPA: hypothetical protein [Caudoviricetes sp.]
MFLRHCFSLLFYSVLFHSIKHFFYLRKLLYTYKYHIAF